MIYEQQEEEALMLEGEFDIAVPFSFAVYEEDGEPEIRVYPSLRPLAEEFLEKFADAPFSDAAIAWAREAFGTFLEKNGFEVGEESEDYFINYRLKPVDGDAVQTTTLPLGYDEELLNLTDYDINTMIEYGHLCCGTVVDGKIVSAACTNQPVFDDTEDCEVEIGVETVPDYAGHGYGRSNVAALTSRLASRGCTALYECASKNLPSKKLIESLDGEEYAKNYYVVGTRADE